MFWPIALASLRHRHRRKLMRQMPWLRVLRSLCQAARHWTTVKGESVGSTALGKWGSVARPGVAMRGPVEKGWCGSALGCHGQACDVGEA